MLACVIAERTQAVSAGILFCKITLPSFAFFPSISWTEILRGEKSFSRRGGGWWCQVFHPDAAGCDFCTIARWSPTPALDKPGQFG